MSKHLRIYVCGSHSTGKTTLARQVADRTGLPFLNEIARQVIAERELTFEVMRANVSLVNDYQEEVFKRQIKHEEQHQSFVSDRCFDNLAYSARHTEIFQTLMKRPAIKSYIKKVKNSLVFFIRPHPDLMMTDGFREQSNWNEIVRIDAMVEMLISWFDIPVIGITELNMRNRLRTAMSAVRWYRNGS